MFQSGAVCRMVGKEEARPRGKLTPYAFFVQICREEHKRKYPEEKVGNPGKKYWKNT